MSKLTTEQQKQLWDAIKYSYNRSDILRNNAQILKHVLLSQKIGRVTEPLAESIVWIAKSYGCRGNYAGYSYLDDMVAFAVMHMLMVALKFNPNKSSNPYAFFVQVTNGAFCNFMNRESRESRTKSDMLEERKQLAEENVWQDHEYQ